MRNTATGVKQRGTMITRRALSKEDCYALTFPDHTFDVVCLANLIHIVETPARVMEEAHRVLKKDGTVIVLDVTSFGLPLWSKLSMAWRYLRAFGLPPKTNRVLRPATLARIVQAAGFNVTSSELLGYETHAICLKGER